MKYMYEIVRPGHRDSDQAVVDILSKLGEKGYRVVFVTNEQGKQMYLLEKESASTSKKKAVKSDKVTA